MKNEVKNLINFFQCKNIFKKIIKYFIIIFNNIKLIL